MLSRYRRWKAVLKSAMCVATGPARASGEWHVSSPVRFFGFCIKVYPPISIPRDLAYAVSAATRAMYVWVGVGVG